jgi:hypothetical protein
MGRILFILENIVAASAFLVIAYIMANIYGTHLVFPFFSCMAVACVVGFVIGGYAEAPNGGKGEENGKV